MALSMPLGLFAYIYAYIYMCTRVQVNAFAKAQYVRFGKAFALW